MAGKGYSSGGYSSGDPLDDMPPSPPGRDAQPSSAPLGRPAPSAGSMSLVGAGPAGALAADMMQLEQLVMKISKQVPALANAAAPFIDQMRDLGAAALSDKSQGGVGSTNPDVTAPPPGIGMPPGGPGAGAGPGLVPPPPMAMMR